MSGKKSDLALIEKQKRVVELRINHAMTFAQIAEQLGYANPSGVLKAYRSGLARIEHPEKEEYFKAHVQRLDALIDTYYNAALQGDLRATDMLLRTMAQQAELLGLKAPVKISQEVSHNGPRTIEEEVTELARIIDYIEGITADITTLPTEPHESEPS